MDLITSLPLTSSGFDAVFTVVDRFSKLVTFIPTNTSVDAPGLAKLFFQNIVCKFGMPSSIVSDRDTRFTSLFWKSLLDMLGCKMGMSSAYYP